MTHAAELPRGAWLVWVKGRSGKVFPQLWYEPFVGASSGCEVAARHRLPIGADRIFTLDDLAGLPQMKHRAA